MHADRVPQFTFFSCHAQEAQHASSWAELAPHFEKETSKSEDDVWWIDVCDGAEEDVAAVARSLSIHPLTVEDIALQEPRQKIETFPDYYLITQRTLSASLDDDQEIEQPKFSEEGPLLPTPRRASPEMLFILVFGHGTVTFSRSDSGHVSRVRNRLARLHDWSVLSSDWICYALLDDVIDSFQPKIEGISSESEAIQDQIYIARDDDMTPLMLRIYNLRKRINHLTHSLSGKSDVLNGFVKRCQTKRWHPAFPAGDLIVYLSDVQDHLVTILAELSHLDEITSRLQSNFLAQTSVHNMRLSAKLNSGLSKVTVLATIFVPLHMVTGLFGMNVTVPGDDIEGSLAWFFGIVGVFIAVILAACFAAWRFKLL
ncbi:hypothetical protein ASPSYDRAFT_145592 [Aspergillus sydowii CBS 593.65]|uniref:CorA family metal ion transporter n=1 Tax=Aspergillus sydowii CBS 593.65 TaxID=1036612 RepID=A0A1L9TQJ9_9EURO|nr:uncharacterized protein ASPSYDRAFT_145592 [Aspergillus sydowii CBS 593.65]OJJ61716.1 hypothetical protein ASPSYDRAFT_145592 [Aspergillus sydowii CBS 593.65]